MEDSDYLRDDLEDALERCYECRTYGDDWTYDSDGELVDRCEECPFSHW